MLRDLTDDGLAWRRKVVVMGGDVRQVLPVVRCGIRAQVFDACINRSPFWLSVHQLLLTQNMRVLRSGSETRSCSTSVLGK